MSDNGYGVALRRIRKRQRLALEALGRLSGVPFEHIGDIERGGVKSPGIVNLTKICRGLGITVNDLLIEAGEMEAPEGYAPPSVSGPDAPLTVSALRMVLREELQAHGMVFARTTATGEGTEDARRPPSGAATHTGRLRGSETTGAPPALVGEDKPAVSRRKRKAV